MKIKIVDSAFASNQVTVLNHNLIKVDFGYPLERVFDDITYSTRKAVVRLVDADAFHPEKDTKSLTIEADENVWVGVVPHPTGVFLTVVPSGDKRLKPWRTVELLASDQIRWQRCDSAGNVIAQALSKPQTRVVDAMLAANGYILEGDETP